MDRLRRTVAAGGGVALAVSSDTGVEIGAGLHTPPRDGLAEIATNRSRVVAPTPTGPPRRTLRWILAHLVEEVGRHAGHADIIREQLDGSVGR